MGRKRRASKERNSVPAASPSTQPLLSDALASDDPAQSLLSTPAKARAGLEGADALEGLPRAREPSPEGDELPTIRASVAVPDVDGSLKTDDSYVYLRPHPYQRCDDDGRPRTFVVGFIIGGM